VGVLAFFSALNSFQVSQGYSANISRRLRAEIRFAPLAARTPSNAELGYITDLIPPNPPTRRPFSRRSTLWPPRLLMAVTAATGDRPEWAAGNFTKPLDTPPPARL
jgi:hypothetical protein